MHVRFVGEADDGISVSSHHARALAQAGVAVSFEGAQPPEGGGGGRADAIHVVTFEQQSNALLRRLVAVRMAGAAIVRYWTGRDALWAKFHGPTREFARTLVQLGAVQLCRTAALAEELAQWGIEATPIPVISTNLSSAASPRAMPPAFTVLSYLPRDRRMFHGGAIVDALVRRLPGVRFLVLGDAGEGFGGLRNVEGLGTVEDAARAIQRATAVVDARLDGAMSRMVLEAMCHGRHVVSSHSLPHACAARTVEEFEKGVRLLRGQAEFNLAGREFVCREHDQPAAVRTLRQVLEEAVGPGRLNLAIAGGVRGATAALRNLHLLGRRSFALPEPETLPPEAVALRALLSCTSQANAVVTA